MSHRLEHALGVRFGSGIDSTKAGMDASQALNVSFGQGIPVVRDIHKVLAYQPDTLRIGIAPQGGNLPREWRWQLLAAMKQA